MKTIILCAIVYMFSIGISYSVDLGDKPCKLFGDYIEWEIKNEDIRINPFDIIGKVTFTHLKTNQKRVTEMFYAGGNTWKFRFTGTKEDKWAFTTSSNNKYLDGHRGTVSVKSNQEENIHGFIENVGNKWAWGGTGQVFAPQYVMYETPDFFENNKDKVGQDIREFIGEHGFTGFHVPSIGMGWFDINLSGKGYDKMDIDDPNPDIRTFEALEMLIVQTHRAGGAVHIWQWGDQQRKMTPVKWGINGEVDRRLQRYICARLGSLAGWTMGYGFDLQEWVKSEDLQEWHTYMQEHLGWKHYLGARAPEMTQIYDGLDYISYQQHRPTYEMYVKGLEQYPDRPVFFEDRFRVRNVERYKSKDYNLDMVRQGLWHSTMAGGAANIWGYLLPERVGGMSNSFPNQDQIITWSKFFKNRFSKEMVRDNQLTDGVCLRDADRLYVFYKEGSNNINMNLSGLLEPLEVIAVNTETKYKEFHVTGIKAQTDQVFNVPFKGDWAVAVERRPEPISSVAVFARHIMINNRVVFLVGQMDSQITCTADTIELGKILDKMMVPYGMNVLMSNMGVIDWGGWNNLVNSQKGIEKKRTGFEYPWKRAGEGETLFGGSKFDLDQFDEEYFERIRAKVKLINSKGILPVVGIFSEHGIDHPLHWRGHPFNPENNVNSLGLPGNNAIPDFFENKKALEYQEKYVKKLLAVLKGTFYILYPFGEADRTPDGFIHRYLKIFEEFEKKSGEQLIVCLSGSGEIIEKFAKEPMVDIIDISYYHGGSYDGEELNVMSGKCGILNTIFRVHEIFDKGQGSKPVVKFYFKYGYPYSYTESVWADKNTGTDGGGSPKAAKDAMKGVYESGGAGIFFKMAWERDRGEYMKPDMWSEDIKEFLKEIKLYD